MATQVIYLVMDCYPMTGSGVFRDFAGATVGCWVRSDICGGHPGTEVFARNRVSAAGWHVVRTLVCEEVSGTTYLNKSEGREYFEQAKTDGFVANFHVRARESIGETGDATENLSESLVRVADMIACDGGFSLFSGRERQWANGVTPAGDEFLPLWASAEDVAGWLEFWPGYEIRRVSTGELRSSGLLERVDVSVMWIALGIGKETLTMCHGAWLQERVTGVVVQRPFLE